MALGVSGGRSRRGSMVPRVCGRTPRMTRNPLQGLHGLPALRLQGCQHGGDHAVHCAAASAAKQNAERCAGRLQGQAIP